MKDNSVDCTARYPNGEAYNIAEGILRVNSERALCLVDGAYVVDMVGTANVFLPGHSIRVDVRGFGHVQKSVCTDLRSPYAVGYVIISSRRGVGRIVQSLVLPFKTHKKTS